MRFAVDTGGTFTDLVVEDDDGRLHMFKAQTTPHDPISGVLDSLQVAASLRQRLEARYPKLASMRVSTTPDQFVVNLALPAEPQEVRT